MTSMSASNRPSEPDPGPRARDESAAVLAEGLDGPVTASGVGSDLGGGQVEEDLAAARPAVGAGGALEPGRDEPRHVTAQDWLESRAGPGGGRTRARRA